MIDKILKSKAPPRRGKTFLASESVTEGHP